MARSEEEDINSLLQLNPRPLISRGKQIEHGPHQHVSARNRREFCITASCRLEVAR